MATYFLTLVSGSLPLAAVSMTSGGASEDTAEGIGGLNGVEGKRVSLIICSHI